MISKATTLDSDTICMDLEDSVAPNKKTEARQNIVTALNTLNFGRSERLVRVNPVDSPFYKDDITLVLSSSVLPDGIVIPKVQHADDLQLVNDALDRLGPKGTSIQLVALIECAMAIVNLGSIAKATPRLSGLIFGADDFAADVGAIRTKGGAEVLQARHMVLLYAAAHRLQAIDMVHIDLEDEAQFIRECEEGLQMGYTGKQIIHPKQIAPANRCFSPPLSALQWAKRVVESAKKYDADGLGAFVLDNKMIDLPTIKNAEKLLAKGVACGLISPEK